MFFTLGALNLYLMKPFLKQSKNESQRVAELLSQLPEELNVEGLIEKASGKKENVFSSTTSQKIEASRLSLGNMAGSQHQLQSPAPKKRDSHPEPRRNSIADGRAQPLPSKSPSKRASFELPKEPAGEIQRTLKSNKVAPKDFDL